VTGRAWVDAVLGVIVATGTYFLGRRHERAVWVNRARASFRHRTRVTDLTGRGDTT
jgi:hypothetical protein